MVWLRNGGGGEADVVVVDGRDEGEVIGGSSHREDETLPKMNPEGQDQ
jgi:hypothetical protein